MINVPDMRNFFISKFLNDTSDDRVIIETGLLSTDRTRTASTQSWIDAVEAFAKSTIQKKLSLQELQVQSKLNLIRISGRNGSAVLERTPIRSTHDLVNSEAEIQCKKKKGRSGTHEMRN